MVGPSERLCLVRLAKPIKNGRAYLANRAGPEGALTNATERGRRGSKASQQHNAAFDCPGGDMTTIVHDVNRPATGSTEPGSAAAETADPHGGSSEAAFTGRPGSETVSCFDAEIIPRMTGIGAKR